VLKFGLPYFDLIGGFHSPSRIALGFANPGFGVWKFDRLGFFSFACNNLMNSQITKSTFYFLLLISLVFSALVLAHSSWRGRLQYNIDYEDVITHIDGLKRYRALVDQPQGRLQFFYQYVMDPPHAPLHSAQAALAFAIFGVYDWAPYASNFILLFGLLGAFVFVAARFGWWAVFIGLIYLLLTPLSYNTVAEFRPDYPSAIFTIWGILFYFEFLRNRNLRLAALSGVFYGMAMLAKPPVFLYVMAIGGAPFFWGMICGYRDSGWKGLQKSILSAWPFFLACFFVAGPHFLIAAHKIYSYIVLNQFSPDAQLWAFKGGVGERLSYALSGYGGWIALGRMWRIALGLLLAAIFLGVYLLRKKEAAGSYLLGGVGMTLYAYFFLVINPHMNPYFGLTFQILLIFTGAGTLGVAAWMFKPLPIKFLSLAAVTCLLFFVLLKAFPLPIRQVDFTLGSKSNKAFLQTVNESAMRILAAFTSVSDGSLVMISSYGPISPHTLQWMSDKNEEGFKFLGTPYSDFKSFKKLFDNSEGGPSRVDFAIVSEPNLIGVHEFLPNAKTSEPLLYYLKKKSEYLEVARIPDPNGRAYTIFLREPSFSPISASPGLSKKLPPWDGRLQKKPARILLQATENQFTFQSTQAGNYEFEIGIFCKHDNAQVTVKQNELEIGRIITKKGENIYLSLPVQLAVGANFFSIKVSDISDGAFAKEDIYLTRLRFIEKNGLRPVEQLVQQWANGKGF
jgi:hypothetical protein